MTRTTQQLTFEEYLSYDDGTDVRCEWVDGELYPMTPASWGHKSIMRFLFLQFYLEIQRQGLGWEPYEDGLGVRTMQQRVRLPDLCIFQERPALARNEAAILTTPPLLVVEIVSPESISRDYRTKRSEYATFEITEYWIVDPLAQKVSILQLVEGFYDVREFTGQERIISPLFAELMLTANQILQGV
ncbi:Uma2 family endonuclease [Candidatus Cyanaurora vandensis]|uniref:Uma2 family endonuclease n=1 Tax=Candidatus Cyanaurora vandensis TaxID=2714958 RepID=UPI0025802996|nr:Uma2 family endonuclease [Candidatus Cyanaurora vandensis]